MTPAGATLLRWRRVRRRGSAAVLLAVGGYLAGIGATSVLPTVVETRNYSAEVRLTLAPSAQPSIRVPTSFGDLELQFSTWLPAPGIDAVVQTKQSITSVLDDRTLSLESLRPTQAELSAALSDAVREVGLKFVAGTVTLTVFFVAILAYGRRRRPTRAHAVLATITAFGVVTATGTSAAYAYQGSQLASYRATGLLALANENRQILGQVEARARQATPYVRNLLALSQVLQESFTPEDLQVPPVTRVLLVSDIHGANQYPVMQQIVTDAKVDVVVDAGDLLNFGSVAEAEASGIFQAIERLGVPYLFVRGNHDALGPADQSLLQRLARIPNVILLQPGQNDFTEVVVRGVRIAGLNDPRYFGDDDRDNAAEQQPAVQAFNAAFAERGAPDLVVSHEPAAAAGVTGVVRVNGHMHTKALNGNRITVGTFTGGGPLTHFVTRTPARGPAASSVGGSTGDPTAAAREEELISQPYAFDIATFGPQCALTSLTRYTFRDLVSGRPAYDDIAVVSGRTIGGDPDPGRSCSAALGIFRIPVTVPAADRSTGSPS